jgi:hypothetical protein
MDENPLADLESPPDCLCDQVEFVGIRVPAVWPVNHEGHVERAVWLVRQLFLSLVPRSIFGHRDARPVIRDAVSEGLSVLSPAQKEFWEDLRGCF